MRSKAVTRLILAISLFFVSNVLRANESSPAPEPAGVIEISKTDILNNLKTGAEVDSAVCSTQNYVGPLTFFWALPSANRTEIAMRFSTVADDTLKEVSVSIYDPGNGSFGDDTIYVKIYSDNLGLPGTLLDTKTVPPGTYPQYPSRLLVTFSAGPVLYEDFHVGISTSAAVGSGRYESILSDSGGTGTGRSSYWRQGTWEPFSPGNEPDYNFDIEVKTCHSPGPYLSEISGVKFRDLNRNGIYDSPTETGILGWWIYLERVGGPPIPPQQTDINGNYLFTFLAPGTYKVSEENRSGWVQTAPTSVTGTVGIAAGPPAGYIGPDFGNDTTKCDPGVVQIDTCLAGTKDNFVGAQPSSPSAGLLTALGASAFPWFDSLTDNKHFGHTFDCWDSNCLVMDAQLTMHIKATGDLPQTDALYLGEWPVPGTIWAIHLNDLEVYAGGTPPWSLGDDMTVTLYLDALPGSAFNAVGPTNILAALQDGDLDIFIQDDTEVDWLELTDTLCCRDSCALDTLWINTAFDQASGSVLAPGFPVPTLDPEWLVVAAPAGSPAGTLGPAKVVDPYFSAWSPALLNSNWVTALAEPSNSTQPDPSALAGDYDFEYRFCLKPGFTNPRLDLDLRTDNASQIFLNGPPAIGTTNATSFMNPATHITATTGFVTGCNTITIRVDNDGLPVGLNLAGFVTANGTVVGEAACCCSCFTYGDINGDGVPLTTADLTYLYAFFNGTGPAPNPLYEADLNGDCVINGLDFQKLQDYFVHGIGVFPIYPVPTCCDPSLPRCGDANGNGIVNVADVVYLIQFIFGGGPAPAPLATGDANCNGIVNIADVVYLIQYIFGGGPAPCEACP